MPSKCLRNVFEERERCFAFEMPSKCLAFEWAEKLERRDFEERESVVGSFVTKNSLSLGVFRFNLESNRHLCEAKIP
jgi:hypothetical protein